MFWLSGAVSLYDLRIASCIALTAYDFSMVARRPRLCRDGLDRHQAEQFQAHMFTDTESLKSGCIQVEQELSRIISLRRQRHAELCRL